MTSGGYNGEQTPETYSTDIEKLRISHRIFSWFNDGTLRHVLCGSALLKYAEQSYKCFEEWFSLWYTLFRGEIFFYTSRVTNLNIMLRRS